MSNTYQKRTRHAEPDRLPGEMTIPEQVVVSMAEIAESAKEGLLALAVGTGLQVMAAMFAEDAGRLAGRAASTIRTGLGTGTAPGKGRSPWAAAPAGDPAPGPGSRRVRELHLPSYDLFSSTEILGRMPWRRCWPGCRRAATQPAGARRAGRGAGGRGYVEVGGVAPVRGRDRDRPG